MIVAYPTPEALANPEPLKKLKLKKLKKLGALFKLHLFKGRSRGYQRGHGEWEAGGRG